LPGNRYYRLSVHFKLQDEAFYLSQNQAMTIPLRFLEITPPDAKGDYEASLLLDTHDPSLQNRQGLYLLADLEKTSFPSLHKTGSRQSFAEFCNSKQMYIKQIDAPGRLFSFEFTEEMSAACQAVSTK